MSATAPKFSIPPLTIARPDPARPIFSVIGAASLALLAGTTILFGDESVTFDAETPINIGFNFEAGDDVEIILRLDRTLEAVPYGHAGGSGRPVIGGGHFAPGGNATARAGGSDSPQFNPFSLYDAGWRPAAPNPRGLTYVDHGGVKPFWAGSYFLGRDHIADGPSRHGVLIADGGSNKPQKPGGGHYDNLNYTTAEEIAAFHGMRLMTFEEGAAALYGVTERTSDSEKALLTGLSAARTSRACVFQGIGQRWTWITDGDPDDPRASILGGSWIGGSVAGSRYARLGGWPELSGGLIGLRLACDHLITV